MSFDIIYGLKDKDVPRIRDKFQFPPSVNLRIPIRTKREYASAYDGPGGGCK